MRVPSQLASAARRGMSVFTQRVNPVTGAVDWEMQPESYDYQQEVARSAYADMLHDTERVSCDTQTCCMTQRVS